HAVASMLPDQPNISKIHGEPIIGPNGIIYLPLYHPAAALHNGSLRATLLADFAKIQDLITKF
ncbi:MAG: uracil-DNA glycosylase, partial [Candidatus Berkelbacteria bacterium]